MVRELLHLDGGGIGLPISCPILRVIVPPLSVLHVLHFNLSVDPSMMMSQLAWIRYMPVDDRRESLKSLIWLAIV